MKTKQHTQGMMLILQAIFSIHKMSIRKNDISNTYTFIVDFRIIFTLSGVGGNSDSRLSRRTVAIRRSILQNKCKNNCIFHYNMHPILTYDKHMFIASFSTFNNILFCIRKLLDKYHPQTTDFTRQEQNRESVQFYKFLFFNRCLTNPYVDCSYSTVQKRTGCT